MRRAICVATCLLCGFIAVPEAAAERKQGRVDASAQRPAQRMWESMSTFAAVSVPAPDEERLDEYTGIVKGVFADINSNISVYVTESELSRLNRSAGKRPVRISDRATAVLQLAQKYYKISEEAFDPTVAPLLDLWGFSTGTVPAKLPNRRVVGRALRSTGLSHLVLSNNTAFLDAPGLSVDLGGIAKGYAVDLGYDELVARDAQDVMINLGGNIRCRGKARGTKPWTVGVRNPFDRGTIIGTISLSEGRAVATSGNYERFVTIANERYTHIIDPRTGYPVKGMAGVTVISDSAVEADAMSTALFVLGVERSRSVLAKLPNCHALLIEDKRPLKIWVTPGFRKHFKALLPDLVMTDLTE